MSLKITSCSGTIAAILAAIFILGLTGCGSPINKDYSFYLNGKSTDVIVPDSNFLNKIEITIPSSTTDLLACVKCHKGLKPNSKKRVLKGTHLDFPYDHPSLNSENKWCYSCHDPLALNVLKLESGKQVSFEKSYELCIQCHITNYSFWAVGLHGRRTGMWNGDKQYLSCVYCHNAHTPKFKPLVPKNPPLRPN